MFAAGKTRYIEWSVHVEKKERNWLKIDEYKEL